jgi:hypothetical protein
LSLSQFAAFARAAAISRSRASTVAASSAFCLGRSWTQILTEHPTMTNE